MDKLQPSFTNPPLIEVAISIQFKHLDGLSNAHLGLFWQSMAKSFPKVQDALPLTPQTELFGDAIQHRLRLPGFRIVPAKTDIRLQMVSSDGNRMVQAQNGRLIYNWMRPSSNQLPQYPRWPAMLEDFESTKAQFMVNLSNAGFDPPELTQWEVTYVNHLERGRDWTTARDWHLLMPGLCANLENAGMGLPENVNIQTQYVLPDNSARLYVDLHNGYRETRAGIPEILVLQLTARAGFPTPTPTNTDISRCLKTGHDCIVQTFAAITGDHAHKIWERTQ